MSNGETVDALRGVSIFSMLDDAEIQAISRILHAERISKGTVLFRQGDAGSEMFVVQSGCIASAIRLPDGGAREIASFRGGEFFGEMSIFESAPRSATCSAKEDTLIYGLKADAFFAFTERNPAIAIKLMYRMLNVTVQRLEKTGAFLSDMVTWGEAARKRAVTDELTGVYNRRFLEDVIVDHMRGAQSTGQPLSVAMVDLDRFREINEGYGNEMGDRVILEAVRIFKKHLRPTDVVARYGGDEFTIMLPDTPLDVAVAIGNEIRADVAALTVLADAGIDGAIKRVSTSQGIATFPDCADDLQQLRAVADEALYRAKEAGKNRVEAAPDRGERKQ